MSGAKVENSWELGVIFWRVLHFFDKAIILEFIGILCIFGIVAQEYMYFVI